MGLGLLQVGTEINIERVETRAMCGPRSFTLLPNVSCRKYNGTLDMCAVASLCMNQALCLNNTLSVLLKCMKKCVS